MRLICPNCDAQYEVPDNVIPETGRDVQCSDCGNTWFQPPAGAEPEETPFERQPIPSEVSEILHEEAEYERQARARDQGEEVFDYPEDAADDFDEDVQDILSEPEPEPAPQPDPSNPFAIDPDPEEPEESDAERRARETAERMARMRGIEASNPFTAASDSRKGVLPDVDALNSSLSPDREAARTKTTIDLEDLNRRKQRGSGFRTGFTLMIFLGLLVILVYSTHENVGRALPFAASALDAFADNVDQWRYWVEQEAGNLMTRLDEIVSNILNG